MKTLCIVEDDAATMKLYHFQFRSLPFALRGYESGEDMLADLDKMSFDAFILDLDLPGKSGLQLLGELRQSARYFETPIILVSAQDYAHVRESLYEAGATAVFAKPFSPSLLKQCVLEFLGLEAS